MAKISSKKLFRKLKQSKALQRTLYSTAVNRLFYKYGTKARLLWLNIEFTSLCDLKCKMCSLDRTQPKGFMDVGLFEKILNEINTSNEIEVENISLWLGGETLLHPNLLKMLEILAVKRNEVKDFPYVTLLTNANSLYGEKTDALLNADAIDCILFSIDGGTKESFEALRRGAKWEKILRNIREFLSKNNELGKRIRTGMVSIIDPEKKCSDEFLTLKKSVDEFLPRDLHNWDGSIELPLGIRGSIQKTGLCYPIMRQMAIHWDGRVSPCCIDLNTRGPMGNLRNQTLYTIYHSHQRKLMIHKMLKGLRREIPLCRHCEH
jgi:MoaA/NifB/PqqE/SkfB family radical SAM enzyme